MSSIGGGPTVEEPQLTVDERPSLWRRRFLIVSTALLVVFLMSTTTLVVSGTAFSPFMAVQVLEGRMGSKSDFFLDRQVQRILLKHHIRVHVTVSPGSRAIATGDLSPYDFVFPSGQPAADLITGQRQAKKQYAQAYRPFVSPIVLATFREYAETLRDAGAATAQPSPQGQPLYYTLDMGKFLALAGAQKRWNDLGIKKHGIANGNIVAAQTSNVCDSNSAGTYLGLVAFTENGGKVPTSDTEATALATRIKPLLVSQGMPGSDMSAPYTSLEGRDVAPVAVMYEHQYLSYQSQYVADYKKVDSGRVLLYPATQFVTQPQLIALNHKADRLGELITHDPALRERAMDLGFRVLNPTGSVDKDRLTAFLQKQGIPVPANGGDDTRTSLPDLQFLERMISDVGGCPSALTPNRKAP